ncbi:MAG: outer membrane beta-barrel protein, partial [Salinibacter sp.]
TGSPRPAEAQQIRVGAGGGWAPATTTVTYAGVSGGQDVEADVSTSYGRHVYAGGGFVRRLSSNFNLGVRLRAQESRFAGDGGDLRAPCEVDCTLSNSLEGRVRALTMEGRIILTSAGRIEPYLLVGLGAVRTTMDGVRVQFEGRQDIPFSDIEVTDAGGDVGLGASVQLAGGLHLDAEFRATGSLPGGKENAVTVLPLSLGLGYNFGTL